MGLFPKIDRPCPYAGRLASVMDGDFCRMCQRTVTDLDAMDTRERQAFLNACAGEDVCITYRIKPALAAAVLVAAFAMASPAMAQDMSDSEEDMIVVTGGRGPRPPLLEVSVPVQLLTPPDYRAHRPPPRRHAPRAERKRSPG